MVRQTALNEKKRVQMAVQTPSNLEETEQSAEVRRLYDRALDHHRAGRLEDAVKTYGQVLRLAPDAADIYNNLGVALRSQGKAEAAVACYRRSLGLRPGAASVYTNLGNALRDMGETAKAVEAHRRAIKNGPKSAKALFNAGLSFREAGHIKAALDYFNQAIKLEPAYTQCRVDHALTLLMAGDWLAGFKELEIRFALKGRDPRRADIPAWTGAPLNDKTILINYEGDESLAVLFCRFCAILKRGGATVIMETPPHLAHLMSASPHVDTTIAMGAPVPGDVDVQIPLLSIPARLGTTLETLVEEDRYLNVPKIGSLTLNIHPDARLAVGLVWSGRWDGRIPNGAKRHGDMTLSDMSELVGIAHMQLFSLERGQGAADITSLGLQSLIEPTGQMVMDLADMASAVDQLDLVICTDSATAHIAGALGKPVWVLLDSGPAWYWLQDRLDSPWYPTMRLFRRNVGEDWSKPVGAIRQALMDVLKDA